MEIEPLERVEAPYELPLWIIISAVVAGILLLGIIIVILWKVRLTIAAAFLQTPNNPESLRAHFFIVS